MANKLPTLTVVLLAPFGVSELDDILDALGHQTIASEIEVFIGLRTAEPPPGSEVTGRFHSFTMFVEAPMVNSGEAKARAVRMARAPVVAFAEDHCFPEVDWAESLLAAHRGRWAAVAPYIGLANPNSILARASFENSFGPWSHQRRGECFNLPTHNTSYKRELLLEYGDDLGPNLDMEAAYLAPDLLRRGYAILFEPAARVHHINVERLGSYIVEQYLGGRHYGALRCEQWPMSRRLLYGGTAWLIPALRLLRRWRSVKTLGTLPLILASVAGMTVSAFGEAVGYFLGLGRTDSRRFEMEYARWRHTAKRHRGHEILAT